MKILITGSSGYIAKQLIRRIPDEDEIIAISRTIDNDVGNIRYVFCDMNHYSNLPSIISDRDIDVCIHFSWEGVSGEKKSSYGSQLNNVTRTIDLIHSLSQMNVKRFIGIGTLAEKEVSEYYLQDLSVPSRSSLYGVCKLFAHMLSKYVCETIDMRYTWCTIANVYGPEDKSSNFINYAIKEMSISGKASFTKGDQLYDFVYIDDVVDALIGVISTNTNHSEYYIGSGSPRSLRDYINEIREQVNPNKEIQYGEIDYKNVYLERKDFDVSALNDIGINPKISFEIGLKKMLSNK